MSAPVRWTIKVSKETDLSLRTMLGAQGMKKGGLSKYVEDAVRWRMLESSIESVRNSLRSAPAAERQATLDVAVRAVRKEVRRRKK